MSLAEELQRPHPDRARHGQVEQHQVRVMRARRLDPRLSVARVQHDEGRDRVAEQRRHTLANHRVIIDDQDLHGASLSRAKKRVCKTRVLRLLRRVLRPTSD